MMAMTLRTHEISLYHYALLPNYVHLLVQPTEGPALSRAMSTINLSYARLFQTRYQYSGHVWQGRYTTVLTAREKSLLDSGRYIELSPVRSGIVREPAAYPWSSFSIYAHGLDASFLATNPAYHVLGVTATQRQGAYRHFVRSNAVQVTEAQAFTQIIRDLQTRFGYSASRPKRGRPRKVQAPDTFRSNLGTLFFLGKPHRRQGNWKLLHRIGSRAAARFSFTNHC